MPNNIKNIMRIEGDSATVKKALNFIKPKYNRHEVIDFGRVIPRPATLLIEESSRTRDAYTYAKYIREGNSRPISAIQVYGVAIITEAEKRAERLGNIALYNKEKYGYMTLYDWSIYKWGTKWNAYESSIPDFNTVEFLVANSEPFPVFCKLSALFPTLTFKISYAKEDMGNDGGVFHYKGGHPILHIDYSHGDKRSIEFACNVWGCDYEEYINEQNQ